MNYIKVKLNKDTRNILKLLALLLSIIIIILWAMLLETRGEHSQIENYSAVPEYRESLLLVPSDITRGIRLESDRITGVAMQQVSINKTTYYKNGHAVGNIGIVNKKENPYTIQVDIIRADNNESIMSTGLIDPGYFVENKKLDTSLDIGRYICTARFKLYKVDTLEYVGQASTQVVIVIES